MSKLCKFGVQRKGMLLHHNVLGPHKSEEDRIAKRELATGVLLEQLIFIAKNKLPIQLYTGLLLKLGIVLFGRNQTR